MNNSFIINARARTPHLKDRRVPTPGTLRSLLCMIAGGKGVFQVKSAISDGSVVIARYRFRVWPCAIAGVGECNFRIHAYGMPEEGKCRWSASNCRSVHNRWFRRPIGPIANQDHENSYPFFRIIRRHNGRAWQIGSPALRRVTRNKKHQMWMPVLAVVV